MKWWFKWGFIEGGRSERLGGEPTVEEPTEEEPMQDLKQPSASTSKKYNRSRAVPLQHRFLIYLAVTSLSTHCIG